MIPPIDCPYKGLTAPPCWGCQHYNADMDFCWLNSLTRWTSDNTSAITSETYEVRLKRYERDREKLLQLSKEALVDLILHRPNVY